MARSERTKGSLMKNGLRLALCGGAIIAPAMAGAQSYEPGNGALELWGPEGIAASPLWVQYWLYGMMATFLAGLIFALFGRLEAIVLSLGVLISVFGGQFLAEQMGWAYLSGYVALAHLICWSPALYLLLSRRPFLKERSVYAAWSALATAVVIFSFVFDLRDAAIYLDHVLELGVIG